SGRSGRRPRAGSARALRLAGRRRLQTSARRRWPGATLRATRFQGQLGANRPRAGADRCRRPRLDARDGPSLVLLYPDYAVRAAEDRVVLRREADRTGDCRKSTEALELIRKDESPRRAMRSPDRRGQRVDRGRTRHEATGGRCADPCLDRVEELANRRIRVVAENRREGYVPVVRHLRVLRIPLRPVARPRVHDRRLDTETSDALHDRGPVPEGRRRDDHLGAVRIPEPVDEARNLVRPAEERVREALCADDLAAQLLVPLGKGLDDSLEVDEQIVRDSDRLLP